MVTREQLRAMMTARPFRPFLVKLADGRSFAVEYPENVGCSVDGREMVVHDNDGMHLVEMLQVLELTPHARPDSSERKAGGK
jgi:hypothetical protein